MQKFIYDEYKNRKSIRLKNWDYSTPGCYFVTICVKNMNEIFGIVKNEKMILSEIGIIADQCWQNIPNHYPSARLDEYIVMPNHIHGIIVIDKTALVRVQNFEPVQGRKIAQIPAVRVQNPEPVRLNKFQHIIPRSLGSIIRGFKIGVTEWSRNNNYIYDVWQRSFHDHIIRNEFVLNRIREYIRDNPKKWPSDRNNPENLDM